VNKESETRAEDIAKLQEIMEDKEKAKKMFNDSNGTNHLQLTRARQIYLKVKTILF
jgi:hypothetical protein